MARWNLPSQYSPFPGIEYARIETVDDASPTPFAEADVVEIAREWVSGNQFDGTASIVLRLHDGRRSIWSAFR